MINEPIRRLTDEPAEGIGAGAELGLTLSAGVKAGLLLADCTGGSNSRRFHFWSVTATRLFCSQKA